jgi:secondary thiamine-phosphate synthase enzyme
MIAAEAQARTVHGGSVRVRTAGCFEFLDITEQVQRLVADSGVLSGLVNVQVQHTTAAVVVNENEPLLLEDLKRTLERLAPGDVPYRHDDFSVRTVNMQPGELENGHSHCKALFLPTAQTLNVLDGALQLGRWQRVLLVELDRPRERTVSVVALGL